MIALKKNKQEEEDVGIAMDALHADAAEVKCCSCNSDMLLTYGSLHADAAEARPQAPVILDCQSRADSLSSNIDLVQSRPLCGQRAPCAKRTTCSGPMQKAVKDLGVGGRLVSACDGPNQWKAC